MKFKFAKWRFIFYFYGDEKECEVKDNIIIKDNVEYTFKKTNKAIYLFLKFAPIFALLALVINSYDLSLDRNKIIEYLSAIFVFVGFVFFDDFKRKVYIISLFALIVVLGFYLHHFNLIAYTIKYTIILLIMFWFGISFYNKCYFIYKDGKIVSHFLTTKDLK
ncbi:MULTISPECIES: hypothetical protein [Campylobacter]|uniref:hypothetical protein n=1 Tax=Campylobacter TaxID=194 RepID=UPI000A35B10C|nr:MULTISPECIES: hypothetical protein [Campylobacter]